MEDDGLTKEEREQTSLELRRTLDKVRPFVLKKIAGNKTIISHFPHEVEIHATDLNDLYYKSVIAALAYGRVNHIDSGSFAGSDRIEFDDARLRIAYPATRPLAPTAGEGIEIPTSEDAIEVYYNDYIMNGFLEPNEHYRYSSWAVGMTEFAVSPFDIMLYELHQDLSKKGIKLIEDLKEVERIKTGLDSELYLYEKNVPRGTRTNQLEECIYEFTEKGYGTNHPCIRIGCAESMLRYRWPWKEETERGTSECLVHITPKIRGNKLNFSIFFRSWDLIGGMPENLGGFTRLMEYMVDEINKRKSKEQPYIDKGIIRAVSDGLHVYSHHKKIAGGWARVPEIELEDNYA